MFGSLRKKLNSAMTISENLSQHYLGSQTGSSSRRDDEDESEVNFMAGCSLLSKYEEDWKQIHEFNEMNGEKAAAIAEQIDRIEAVNENKKTTMTDLIRCLSFIPALTEKLEASMEVLRGVQRLIDSAEDKIISLQITCEDYDLQEEMLENKFELSQYKQKKMAELEIFRQKLAAEHQEKIHLHEMKLRQIQKERQAVFEDAFRCDLEEFKQKGSLQKLDHIEVSNELALEEVELDNDDDGTKDALEEFLNEK